MTLARTVRRCPRPLPRTALSRLPRLPVLSLLVLALLGGSSARADIDLTLEHGVASGNALDALVVGDVVTLDIVARNDGSDIFAIAMAAVGYDPTVIGFSSGLALSSVFNTVCISGNCFGGAFNEVGTSVSGPGGFSSRALAEEPHSLGPTVPLIEGAYAASSNGTGASDVGVVTGVVGDAQFRLVFQAVGLGQTVIDVGGFPEYGGGVVGSGGFPDVVNGDSLVITVLPEPTTALLLGLGLAGLAAGRP